VQEALDTPRARLIVVAPDCFENAIAPDCGLAGVQLYMQAAEEDGSAADVSPQTVGRRLARVFGATRTQPSRADPVRRELVGVAVQFGVTLTGFRGDTADVRWSLHSAGTGVRLPDPWLREQRALLLRGEAGRDTASGEFWVPVPRRRGPFFIRIGVYDDDRTRLDFADTPSFR
jgi:hypothetical protein